MQIKLGFQFSSAMKSLICASFFSDYYLQVFPLTEKIENINDQYWTLRAEEVSFTMLSFSFTSRDCVCNVLYIINCFLLQIPEDEKNIGPQDRLIHVYHFIKDSAQNQMVCRMWMNTRLL